MDRPAARRGGAACFEPTSAGCAPSGARHEPAERTAGERPGAGVQGEVERRVGGRDEGSPVGGGRRRDARPRAGWQAGRAAPGGPRRRGAGGEPAARPTAWSAVIGHPAVPPLALAQASAEAADAAPRRSRLWRRCTGWSAPDTPRPRSAPRISRGPRRRFRRPGSPWPRRSAGSSRRARRSPARSRCRSGPSSRSSRSLDRAGRLRVARFHRRGLVRDAGASTRRHEIALALGEYALAEARLRLQVARQYPDLELGPGFIWDQGVHRWTLALALPALLGSRNRGAIARGGGGTRSRPGLDVAEVQDSVLADVESAVQRCRGRDARAGGRRFRGGRGRRPACERERAAYERGETSRLEPRPGRAAAAARPARAPRGRASAVTPRRARAGARSRRSDRRGAKRWPDPRAGTGRGGDRAGETPPGNRVLVVRRADRRQRSRCRPRRPTDRARAAPRTADARRRSWRRAGVAVEDGETRVVLDTAEIRRIGLDDRGARRRRRRAGTRA